MTVTKLKSLLAVWASEKCLHDLVFSDESLIDHFFRYLEETYGCGHLAAHVAHGCIMAFDEHVVRTHCLITIRPGCSGGWPTLVKSFSLLRMAALSACYGMVTDMWPIHQ